MQNYDPEGNPLRVGDQTRMVISPARLGAGRADGTWFGRRKANVFFQNICPGTVKSPVRPPMDVEAYSRPARMDLPQAIVEPPPANVELSPGPFNHDIFAKYTKQHA